MSVKLVIVLVILMGANQVIGTGYGWWKSGFNGQLFLKGIYKIAVLAIGYGAIAFAAKYASAVIPQMEYLSGILLEPIARYFIKVCDSLKNFLNKSTKEVVIAAVVKSDEAVDSNPNEK